MPWAILIGFFYLTSCAVARFSLKGLRGVNNFGHNHFLVYEKKTDLVRGLVSKDILLRSTKENASLISFLRPVSFEMVCLCTAMQNFSRLL